MENRRNYYRILHVQPDAPQVLIKSSYRTLMQTLKMHPDLGGDHWNAQLINEAYSVLCDTDLRAEYDERFLDRVVAERSHSEPQRLAGSEAAKTIIRNAFCLFCKTPYRPETIDIHDGVCQECASPLTRLPEEVVSLDFKRSLQRIKMSEDLQYYTYWPQKPKQAQVSNLSPRGVGLLVPDYIVDEFQVMVKLVGQSFSAVARVAHQKRLQIPQDSYPFYVGMEFKSCRFEKRKGCFVSLRV